MLTTTEDRDRFERDGVVCLRGVFGARWLATLRAGIERNKRQPGRFFRDQTPAGSPARYVFDFWTWPAIPEFAEVIFGSPAGQVAGELMATAAIRLAMDNWFLREAAATNGAPWHCDEPYFDFDGQLCNVLIPLEDASGDEFLTFARGSHRWGKRFMAMHFRDKVPFDGQDSAAGYEPVPDIDADRGAHDLLTFDLAAGDCLVFDLKTLHAATAGQSPLPRTIHRVSLRFAAEGVRFRPRGPWTAEISRHLQNLGQVDGGLLDCPLLPQVWSAAQGLIGAETPLDRP